MLRSYFPGDGTKLCTAAVASYDHLKAEMPWAKPDLSEAEAEETVRRLRAEWLLNRDFVIGIWAPDESELLGGCGFHLREGAIRNGAAEMGMWIAGSRAGQGLGTEALRELVAWGFTEWPWVRLSWRCNAANSASARVAEKAGLALEGTLRSHLVTPAGERRDTLCYAILRSDWQSRSPGP